MHERRWSPLSLLFWIGVSYAPALPGAFFGPDRWYRRLTKPSWTPPDEVFSLVWTALCATLGISIYLVTRRDHPRLPAALGLYFALLLLGTAWTPLFFGLHRPDFALVCVGLQWLTLVSLIGAFARIRPTAALLQLPHLVWVTFAFALNAAIWHLNR
jgi:tryptophan-rich sensory protein